MHLLRCLPVLFLLAACAEPEVTLEQLCEQHPAMCNDLVSDGHCVAERAEVIPLRIAEQKLSSDANKYALLMGFDRYVKCMELVKGIQHIKLKEKTTDRVDSYMIALNEMLRLSEQTVQSDLPGLLYYHWSYNRSKPHMERFLQAAKAGKINTPELKLGLARIYTFQTEDEALAIQTIYEALALYPAGAKINPDIYTSLTTLFFKQKKPAMSYHWALVATKAGVKRIGFEVIEKQAKKLKVDLTGIEEIAKQTLEGIQDGKFVPPTL